MNGNVSLCKSIENGRGTNLPAHWKIWYEIHVLDDDLICITGTDLEGYGMNLAMAIFNLNSLSVVEIIDWILIGSIAGIVVITDVGLIIYLKRRKHASEKPKVDLDDVFNEVFDER
jgi:hypothetical protein